MSQLLQVCRIVLCPDMIFVKSFTPADFPKFRNLPEKVRNLRHLRPKILIFSISIHRIEMLSQFTSLYSHIILHSGLNYPQKIQKMHNIMWNFTPVEIILH